LSENSRKKAAQSHAARYADYDFIDSSIDDLYMAASECFNEWIGRQTA